MKGNQIEKIQIIRDHDIWHVSSRRMKKRWIDTMKTYDSNFFKECSVITDALSRSKSKDYVNSMKFSDIRFFFLDSSNIYKAYWKKKLILLLFSLCDYHWIPFHSLEFPWMRSKILHKKIQIHVEEAIYFAECVLIHILHDFSFTSSTNIFSVEYQSIFKSLLF